MNPFSTAYFLFGSMLVMLNTAVAQQKFTPDMLGRPNDYSSFFEESLPIKEVEIFQHKREGQHVILENGYAKYRFQNSGDWPPQGFDVVPTEVTVIFTQYPKHKSFWLTDYHWLLAKRLEELFALDPRLNDTSIVYNIILQTDCDNEFEAMQLFHGSEVKYRIKTPETTEITIDSLPILSSNTRKPTSQSKKIARFMKQVSFSSDSTVYEVLDRQRNWANAVLVIDWTGSMHGYGAESVLWLSLNEEVSTIRKIALFNDGDRKKNRKKDLGRTGGIYIENARPISKSVKLFNKVKNKGTGGDSPENDIETIAATLAADPSAENVILIADNQSCIRDYDLIECIDKPVHVVLCGTRKGINPQYVNVAWRTGGSLHTKDLDIENLEEMVAKDSIVIDHVRYIRTRDNLLLPADRFANRFGYCDRYYDARKRKPKTKKRKEPKCYFTE